MSEPCVNLVTITENVERSKSNTKRLDNMDEMIKVIHEVNRNVSVIANETKKQGEEIKELISVLKKHEDKFDKIEDQMETKDSVRRLHDRLDKEAEIRKVDIDGLRLDIKLLNDSINTHELSNEKKGNAKWEKFKWILVGLATSSIFALIWEVITK